MWLSFHWNERAALWGKLWKALQFVFLSVRDGSSGTQSLSFRDTASQHQVSRCEVPWFPMKITVIWLSKIKHLFRELTTNHFLSLEDVFPPSFRQMARSLDSTPGPRRASSLYSAGSCNRASPSLWERWLYCVHGMNSSGFSAYILKRAYSPWQSLSDLTELCKICSLKWEKKGNWGLFVFPLGHKFPKLRHSHFCSLVDCNDSMTFCI